VISVSLGTLAHDVLRLVAAHPGELDAGTIAERLLPAPPWRPPFPATHAERAASYAAWLTEERGPLSDDGRARRGGRREAAAARVSRALGRLQERGLIETRGPPIVAPWWLAVAQRRGVLPALRSAADVEGGDLTSHVAMVAEVEKGPRSAAALLGASPSGARKRVYADLIAWGVVLPPSQRWATEAGLALLQNTFALDVAP